MLDCKRRVELVMKRAQCRETQRRERKLTRLKIESLLLLIGLLYWIDRFSDLYQSGSVTGAYGSILLIDGLGGYIFTAVAAFTVATVLTLVILKRKGRKGRNHK